MGASDTAKVRKTNKVRKKPGPKPNLFRKPKKVCFSVNEEVAKLFVDCCKYNHHAQGRLIEHWMKQYNEATLTQIKKRYEIVEQDGGVNGTT